MTGHEHTMPDPVIVINDRVLNAGQVAALRMALSRFGDLMQFPHALGDDAHGLSMTQAYSARCTEINALMAARLPGAHAHAIVESGNGIHCHGSLGHWDWKP